MHQAVCVSREPLAAGGGQGGGGLKMPKTGTLERQGVAEEHVGVGGRQSGRCLIALGWLGSEAVHW